MCAAGVLLSIRRLCSCASVTCNVVDYFHIRSGSVNDEWCVETRLLFWVHVNHFTPVIHLRVKIIKYSLIVRLYFIFSIANRYFSSDYVVSN